MYICVYIHIYIYLYIYIYVYIYIYMYMYVYICIYVYIYTHTHTYICIHTCIHTNTPLHRFPLSQSDTHHTHKTHQHTRLAHTVLTHGHTHVHPHTHTRDTPYSRNLIRNSEFISFKFGILHGDLNHRRITACYEPWPRAVRRFADHSAINSPVTVVSGSENQ